jgi:hypothetical protein
VIVTRCKPHVFAVLRANNNDFEKAGAKAGAGGVFAVRCFVPGLVYEIYSILVPWFVCLQTIVIPPRVERYSIGYPRAPRFYLVL